MLELKLELEEEVTARVVVTVGQGEALEEVLDVDDEDAWAALIEAEGGKGKIASAPKVKEEERPPWLPAGMEPVLEELPKWSLVAAALQEIEEEMIRREAKLSSRKHIVTTSVAIPDIRHE